MKTTLASKTSVRGSEALAAKRRERAIRKIVVACADAVKTGKHALYDGDTVMARMRESIQG